MKKIYLLGLASMFVLGANAQTILKVKNPLKKSKSKVAASSVERNNGGHNSVNQVTGFITCNTFYTAGTTADFNFTITLNNTDQEYGDSLAIELPAGWVANSSPTDPFPTNDDGNGAAVLCYLNTPAGNNIISWGDNNDAQYGGISTLTAGPALNFIINITVPGGATGDQTANFYVSGDTWDNNGATTPGDLSGTFMIYDNATPHTNMAVTAAQPLNLSAIRMCGLGQDTIVGVVKNLGNATEHNITVDYKVNGVTSGSPLVIDSMEAGDTMIVAWIPAYDFSPSDLYTLQVFVSQPNDVMSFDDTTAIDFINTTPTDLSNATYTNGIESDYDYYSFYMDADPNTYVYFGASTTSFHTGTQALFFTVTPQDQTGAVEATAITPCIDLTAGETYRIVYWTRTNINNNGQTGIMYGTSPDFASMNTVIKPYLANTPSNTWKKDSVDFMAANTETGYFGFMAKGTVTTQGVSVRYDDIKIFKAPLVSLKENAAAEAIAVFPNPSNGVFTVKAVENSFVSVYSVIGENVYSANLVKGNNAVDLSNVAAGTYIVKIKSGNDVVTKRVVINK